MHGNMNVKSVYRPVTYSKQRNMMYKLNERKRYHTII
jgi:hypothetical protein